jgi:SAM-dependent methyltransferase
MAEPARLAQLLIEAMAKHLPPSASSLRLLDVGGAAHAVLQQRRADLTVQSLAAHGLPDVADDSIDAITLYDQELDAALLTQALRLLRPGGRLIAVDSHGLPSDDWVRRLEAQGFTRILVETAAECPLPVGVLLRGEKPHLSEDTQVRVRVASTRDDLLTDFAAYPGRYVYTLIRQMPNKPVWALREGESYQWDAIGVQIDGGFALLAFSSLAKAVAFMQPAVLAGQIRDVNKVGKFSVETAKDWAFPVLLNPDEDILMRQAEGVTRLDPFTAEMPDE